MVNRRGRRAGVASGAAGRAFVGGARVAGVLAGALALAACGNSGGKGFDGADASREAEDDTGGGSFGGNDAAHGDDDDGGLASVDAAPVTLGACQPGVYVGAFKCNVTAFFDLFKLPWEGAMSIEFVGSQDNAGEFTTLTIAPGAHIVGTDEYGGAFAADLTGTLDCTAAKLTGSLANASYTIDGADAGPDAGGMAIAFTGGLKADYSGGSTPPAIVNGEMGPLMPASGANVLTPAADCTWSAALKP